MNHSAYKFILIAIISSFAISVQATMIADSVLEESATWAPSAFSSVSEAQQDYPFLYPINTSDITLMSFSSGTLGPLLNDELTINTRVPESGSIILFAVGLFSLIMARKKMKAKST